MSFDDDQDYAEDDWYDEDSEESSTVDCPACGKEIYEDAQRCPYCENYIDAASTDSPRKPLWIILTAVVCIYSILHFYISSLFFG